MSVELNHTIVHGRDARAAAAFFAEVLGLAPPRRFGPFSVVDLANGASLDCIDAGDYPFTPQHYAFLVGEDDFDRIFARIRERGLEYWADPHKEHPGEINRHFGGRGVYFDHPDGHLLEIITRPYGSE